MVHRIYRSKAMKKQRGGKIGSMMTKVGSGVKKGISAGRRIYRAGKKGYFTGKKIYKGVRGGIKFAQKHLGTAMAVAKKGQQAAQIAAMLA